MAQPEALPDPCGLLMGGEFFLPQAGCSRSILRGALDPPPAARRAVLGASILRREAAAPLHDPGNAPRQGREKGGARRSRR